MQCLIMYINISACAFIKFRKNKMGHDIYSNKGGLHVSLNGESNQLKV